MEKTYIVSSVNNEIITKYIDDFRTPNPNISNATIENDINALKKLADFAGDRSFYELSERDLKEFFIGNKEYSGYNSLGVKINQFYRWADKLDKKDTPKRMKWFNYKKREVKDIRDIEKKFITIDEYNKIIKACEKYKYGMWEAIWELFYLSGFRRSELASMRIKDVTLKDGKAWVYCPKSKTKPRKILLIEYPFYLERWINTHPKRDNPNSPLWISLANNNLYDKLKVNSITMKFGKLKKEVGIRKELSVHNFRATRATILFSKGFDDSQMCLYMGWKLSEIGARKEEYDTRGYDDLNKRILEELTPVDSYDVKQRKYDILVNKKDDEIKELNAKIEVLISSKKALDTRFTDLNDRYSKDIGEFKKQFSVLEETHNVLGTFADALTELFSIVETYNYDESKKVIDERVKNQLDKIYSTCGKYKSAEDKRNKSLG